MGGIWDRWYHGNRFHQEPLYAYTLAALWTVFADSAPQALFVLQMLLGIWTVGLLFGLTALALTACSMGESNVESGNREGILHFGNVEEMTQIRRERHAKTIASLEHQIS